MPEEENHPNIPRRSFIKRLAVSIPAILYSRDQVFAKRQTEEPQGSHDETVDESQEAIRAQAIADKKYSEEVAEIYRKYPWYGKLPIEEKNYFVYFDPENAKFIAKLYPQKNSSESLDIQTEQFKQELHQKLEEISPNTLKYPFEYKITLE